jgi:hypothetical protein
MEIRLTLEIIDKNLPTKYEFDNKKFAERLQTSKHVDSSGQYNYNIHRAVLKILKEAETDFIETMIGQAYPLLNQE